LKVWKVSNSRGHWKKFKHIHCTCPPKSWKLGNPIWHQKMGRKESQ